MRKEGSLWDLGQIGAVGIYKSIAVLRRVPSRVASLQLYTVQMTLCTLKVYLLNRVSVFIISTSLGFIQGVLNPYITITGRLLTFRLHYMSTHKISLPLSHMALGFF